MPGLTAEDRVLIDRARNLAGADVSEHTGETVLVLAYARWAGQARDLLGELAGRLEQLGS